jgi:hypothetical protein
MKRALLVAVLAVICWFVFGTHDASWARQELPTITADQSAQSDHLRLLSAGSEIIVYRTDGSKLEAVLLEVQDDAIVVRPKKGGRPTTIMLADIQRLQTRTTGGHPVAYVLLGAASAIGALIVAVAASC